VSKLKACPLSKRHEFFKIFGKEGKGECLHIDIFNEKMGKGDVHIKYDKRFDERVKELKRVYESNRFFLLVSGKRGSGKSVFAEIAKVRGLKGIEMSSIVFKRMVGQGYKINNETTILFSKMIRRRYGSDIVARWTYSTIKEEDKVCISGIRSLDEMRFFKSKRPSLLIFIKAEESTRIKRIFSRKRKTDPNTITQFIEREKVENTELGFNKVEENADLYITNNKDIGSFMEKSDKLIRFLLKDPF